MDALCPECAHHLYGYPNCDHAFVNDGCSRCGWDGSRSRYIRSLLGHQGQRRLFVAQAVQVAESQWFAPGASYGHPSDDGDLRPVRLERHHYIEVFLFPADDAEDAYQKALQCAQNESDVNYDPPGNRNVCYTLGLHELEEYILADDFATDLQRGYTLITRIAPADVNAEGIPLVRSKEELEVFRLKR
jgi:hypothetical protein